jgi:threonine synthase
MGLPVDKLVVATNQNDVLHRFLETGVYKKDPASLTIAPSMDISVSSNFERYLLYLAGGDTAKLAAWMQLFESTGTLRLGKEELLKARSEFASWASDKESIVQTMRGLFDAEQYLVCPHTATAVNAVRALKLPADRTVVLATAHPAKFEEAMALALTEGRATPPQPPALAALAKLPTRKNRLAKSQRKVQEFVKARVAAGWVESEGASGAVAWIGKAIFAAAAAALVAVVVQRVVLASRK